MTSFTLSREHEDFRAVVREFAAEMARDGALVLYGACDAVVRTPYGPFVEALDHLARTVEPAELRQEQGDQAAPLLSYDVLEVGHGQVGSTAGETCMS